MTTTTYERQKGFTLLELVLVMSIIMCFAALLLPGFAKARSYARRISCTNNQRQLAIASLAYAADNRDLLPANGENRMISTRDRLWVQGYFYDPVSRTNTAYILNRNYSLLAETVPNLNTFICPGEPHAVKTADGDYPRLRSYAMNAYVGWQGKWDDRLEPQAFHRVFRKLSQFNDVSASGIFLFMDVNERSICWPYFGVYMSKDFFYNFPSSVHSRGGVASFADGHVEWHRWRDPRTIAAVSDEYHRHSDVSPGNIDLRWLRDRTTCLP